MIRRSGIGFDLRYFRKQLKMSQSNLAALLGVGRTTYGAWEKHEAPPWIELACRGLRASLVFPAISSPMSATEMIRARKQLGLSQDELASELGISRHTISRLENGQPHQWIGYALIALAVTFNTG
ncbi:MAG: hypothetical protein CMK74_04130 [Pseudomonadales bacterium]|nr:hypothetical protein [Pseudomonadales bacterium]|tara:strand:+ start:1252 stop:1626 length:375 start_codon:yes stop_codon:yes gene_type:complete